MFSSFPCGNCPVENITGIWKFRRPPHHRDTTASTPGHLLHYIISGSYKLRIGLNEYNPRAGDILYYYGSEQVIWEGNSSEVNFYSVGFMGTAIPILSSDKRIISSTGDMSEKWNHLWKVSQCNNYQNTTVLAYSILLEIISSIFWHNNDTESVDLYSRSSSDVNWQKIENHIRSGKHYHIHPEELARKSGLSRTAIYNLCRRELSTTPLKRLKEIRIEEAKGLLKYTEMRIGEISDYLGYNRIHDFSREFKKESGLSAREYRLHAKGELL